MLFEVTHESLNTYQRPVFIEPMIVRLRPRTDIFQRLLRFSMNVAPAPSGTTDFIDAEGNAVTRIWFRDLAESLTLTTSFAAETTVTNPFGYVILDAASSALPPPYSPQEKASLARFLSEGGHAPVAAVVDRVRGDSPEGIEGFLMGACRWVADNIRQVHREEGDPMEPGATLAQGSGACRDLTVLFMQMCRAAGIACRFVSGYEAPGEDEDAEPELHAWAEAYLPEVGWRGYDPSRGMAVADRHLAVAAAPFPEGAAPSAGTFRGTGVTGKLETRIRIRCAG